MELTRLVPNRFHDDRMIPDVLIPGPEIPFDEALWNECQTCPIYMGDNTPMRLISLKIFVVITLQ